MGIFDIFKGKSQQQDNPQGGNDLFSSLNKYSEYIVTFMGMQQQGNYAPVSAYETNSGEIRGFLYIIADKSYSLSAAEVIRRMENDFEKKLAAGGIRSYVFLYHSQYNNNDDHRIANNDNELKAISVAYNFGKRLKGKIGLPYRFEDGSVAYTGFKEFSPEESSVIFNTRLEEGKDYFQDREEIIAPVHENAAGIKVSKANELDFENTWGGIFGFQSFRRENGDFELRKHFLMALDEQPVSTHGSLSIHQVDFGDVAFKAMKENGKPYTILPVVKTNYIVETSTRAISEWENFDNRVALVTASGRQTFGITFVATDYAENRELYLSRKDLNTHISGIAFVLDIFKNKNNGEVKYSEEFTAYMPNQDMAHYACFDFIGQVEDLRKIQLLTQKNLEAYLMKVRLITDPERKDFFTIDMYVTQENMRFSGLEKGMKVTGMMQLQGSVAKL